MATGCRYDGAPDWDGGAHCALGPQPGTTALGEALVARWGGSFGGFNCRPNTADESKQSVHGTGRAGDWFPPSKAVGDQAAEWLVQNHERFGVQLVIWQRQDWTCSALDNVPGVGAGDGWTPYGGPNPHTDHLHIELTVPAGRDNTAATYQESLTVDQADRIIDAIKAQTETLTGVIQRNTNRIIDQNAAIAKREAKLARKLTEKEIDEITAAFAKDKG